MNADQLNDRGHEFKIGHNFISNNSNITNFIMDRSNIINSLLLFLFVVFVIFFSCS